MLDLPFCSKASLMNAKHSGKCATRSSEGASQTSTLRYLKQLGWDGSSP